MLDEVLPSRSALPTSGARREIIISAFDFWVGIYKGAVRIAEALPDADDRRAILVQPVAALAAAIVSLVTEGQLFYDCADEPPEKLFSPQTRKTPGKRKRGRPEEPASYRITAPRIQQVSGCKPAEISVCTNLLKLTGIEAKPKSTCFFVTPQRRSHLPYYSPPFMPRADTSAWSK